MLVELTPAWLFQLASNKNDGWSKTQICFLERRRLSLLLLLLLSLLLLL